MRIKIAGIVQGVGFRPFVYGLARENGLGGFVLNTERGVHIEVEGDKRAVEAFLERLSSAPPMAVIDSIETQYLPPLGYSVFKIARSQKKGSSFTLISPDMAVCSECLKELYDPGDRRYGYPFINCTNCGPRFTIIKNIPYDRPYTTMGDFEMCELCRAEYENPLDRRFHAQPIACADCGPRVTLFDSSGKKPAGEDPISATGAFLKSGAIVAIKGLGGFHLACDALNDDAVRKLRKRKYREDKPFAIMCRDIPSVRKSCLLDENSERILASPRCPIVILPRKKDAAISPHVAPGHNCLGVMLPYTPLHHLIFSSGIETLVMTSGNISDEPISYKNEEAFARLKNIADYFLVHNRDIHVRCDDSVVKPFGGKLTFLRRARGYVPSPVVLGSGSSEVLACGGELKNTFCLTKGPYAFVSQHIGDLENWETLMAFEEGIEHYKKIFEIEPGVVAYDPHPDYLSTRYALSLDIPKVPVQHHYAHALSCMAEHDLHGPLLAVIMDGTGYGEDGTIWGCEFLEVTSNNFTRRGHLRYIDLPGGESAIREPWRLAAAYLERIYGAAWTDLDLPISASIDHEKWDLIKKSARQHPGVQSCSSAGRLFDAVSALLGVRYTVNYEGQAAIELEQLAIFDSKAYPYRIITESESLIVDPDPLIEAVVNELLGSEIPPVISGRFHMTMAEIIRDVATRMREATGITDIVLSGGVFQNHLLLELAWRKLQDSSFRIYINRKVPANDGGISLGQAYYATLNFKE